MVCWSFVRGSTFKLLPSFNRGIDKEDGENKVSVGKRRFTIFQYLLLRGKQNTASDCNTSAVTKFLLFFAFREHLKTLRRSIVPESRWKQRTGECSVFLFSFALLRLTGPPLTWLFV